MYKMNEMLNNVKEWGMNRIPKIIKKTLAGALALIVFMIVLEDGLYVELEDLGLVMLMSLCTNLAGEFVGK